MATTANQTPAPVKNRFPWYSPLFWHGMPSIVWWPLLKKHHWNFDWQRLHFVASVSASTVITDTLSLMQHAIFSRKIAQTQLAGPPVFVLGHWRSGTTLLHEVLQLDDAYGCPNTFQCGAPWHFLLTEGVITKFGSFLLPEKRPMDNMKVGWKLPQEDEFALMCLGAVSPYTRIGFPKDSPEIASLSSTTFPADKLEYWKKCFHWFMQATTYHEGKPMILKSPTHTGRVKLLSEMYPDARFIHIARNPKSMIPSTIRLWESLCEVQALQNNATKQADEDYVFECFDTMYEGYESGKQTLSPDRLIEIKYEIFVKEPVTTMESIYSQLQLGDFEQVKPKIEARMNADKDYKTNRWEVPTELANRIATHCSDYSARYGYELKPSAPQA